MKALSPLQRATPLPKGPEKKKSSVKIRPRTNKALDGFGTHLALLAFGFMQDRAETAMLLSLSFLVVQLTAVLRMMIMMLMMLKYCNWYH